MGGHLPNELLSSIESFTRIDAQLNERAVCSDEDYDEYYEDRLNGRLALSEPIETQPGSLPVCLQFFTVEKEVRRRIKSFHLYNVFHNLLLSCKCNSMKCTEDYETVPKPVPNTPDLKITDMTCPNDDEIVPKPVQLYSGKSVRI